MPKGISSIISYKDYDQNQQELLLPSLDDFLPENHPARILSEVIDRINIDNIIATYKGGGTSIYNPKMLLKVIVFAYLNNIYSSRDIAKALREQIPFMWLSCKQYPDFRTINNFRGKRIIEDIENIFSEVVKLMVSKGLCSLKTQYLDGTKIESTSNRYTFVWRGSVEKNLAKLQEQLTSIINDIRKIVDSDSKDGKPEPEYPAITKESLLEAIEEINNKLIIAEEKATKPELKEINKAKTKIKKLETAIYPRLIKYEISLEKLGNRNSYSKTDEDATFMRMKEDHMKNGQLKPAYNIQISTNNQIITHYTLWQTAGDTTTLPGHMESFKEQYGEYPDEVVADAGYGSEENYDYMETKCINNYVKFNTFQIESSKNFQLDISKQENLYYNEEEDYFVCPLGQHMEIQGVKITKSANGFEKKIVIYEAKNCSGCPLAGGCFKSQSKKRLETGDKRRLEVNHNLRRHKAIARINLTSLKGIRYRKQRSVEVESVFGNIKSNKKFNRFKLRGLKKVSMEFGLVAVSHNMKKLIKTEVRPNSNDYPAKAANISIIVENNSIFDIEINFLSKVDMRNTKTIRNIYFDYKYILLSSISLKIKGAA